MFDLKDVFKDAPAGAKRLGVVGWPLGHTLSPAMHNAAFAAWGMEAVYRAIPVKPAEWSEFVLQAKDLLAGFNVTVPYKESIFQAADAEDPFVRKTQAANTVAVAAGGLKAFNTDGDGFLDGLMDAGIPTLGKNVLLLGAGGSARSILGALQKESFRPMRVTVLNRDEVRLARLLERFQGGLRLEAARDMGSMAKAALSAQVLINATSAGLQPGDRHEVFDLSWLHKDLAVYDLIYHRETELMAAARRAGARKVSGGLGMLVHQAARAFEIWFGRKPPVDGMRRAAEDELKRRTTQ